MPYLNLPHHHLHYITTGDPAHPPLLMLHGFLGSHQDFAGVSASLGDRVYCIIPDLPGHGDTVSSHYSFVATAAALLSLLDHLKIYQAHLLGYSMGGRLALYLVCNFPDRFSKIVLESASPGLKTATQRQERIEQDEAIARQLEILALTDFLQQWYSNPLFASLKNHSSLYSALIHRRQNNDKAALAKALRGLGTGRQPSFWEKLSAINTPLLLLAGELDSKFVTIARDMAQHCQIGRTTSLKEIFEIHIFENCGHNIHLESPTYYIQVIAYFLDTASREEFMKEKLNEQSYDRRIHLRATLPPCRKIDRETT